MWKGGIDISQSPVLVIFRKMVKDVSCQFTSSSVVEIAQLGIEMEIITKYFLV